MEKSKSEQILQQLFKENIDFHHKKCNDELNYGGEEALTIPRQIVAGDLERNKAKRNPRKNWKENLGKNDAIRNT